MTSPQKEYPSSEPKWVKILDGSDKDYRLISMYELKKIEHAINETEPGHLKEMHDSGNETIDTVRSRPHTSTPHYQIEPNSNEYTLSQIVEINERLRKEAATIRNATLNEVKKEFELLEATIIRNITTGYKDSDAHNFAVVLSCFNDFKIKSLRGDP